MVQKHEQDVPQHQTTTDPAEGAGDLSARIAATVDRRPGDVVRCARVGDGSYRCNWWAPPVGADGNSPFLRITAYRVRQSRFLRVSVADGRLVIQPSGDR